MSRFARNAALWLALAAPRLAAVDSFGQDSPPAGEAPGVESRAEDVTLGGVAWTVDASVFIYVVPEERTYAQPTLALDRDWLHVEARYNYEAQDTGSLWLGYNFSAGEALALDFTPMIGGAFGRTLGVAPGLELGLSFWKLEFYSEFEYLFATGASADSFAYTWSELNLWPVDLFRLGMAAQRTRAYETEVEVQRGVLVGLAYEWASLAVYVFDLDQSRQTVVVGLGAAF